MGWQNFPIFIPEGDEPSPFRYDSATGQTVPNPDWHGITPAATTDRLIRADEVLSLTGLSKATVWRMERDGRFPRRQKVGKRAVRWRESEVRAWLARR